MKRKLAAALAATAIIMAALAPSAFADSFTTDSWGCTWSGSSYSGVGSTTAKGYLSCADSVGLVFSYYQNGSWTYGTWQWSTADVISGTHAGTQAEGDHQIWVSGEGYGQVRGTSYP